MKITPRPALTSAVEVGTRPLPRLSLRVNFAWTFVGNVVYALCQWGMLVVLAKLGSPEMVGQFAFGFAVTAPVMLLAGLGLRAVQATDAKREYQFSDYLELRITMTLLALIAIIVIVGIGSYSRETQGVILLIGLAKAMESISDVFYGSFQQNERMDRIARSMVIKGVLSVTALTGAVIMTHRVWSGAVAMALAWTLVLVLYDVPNGAFILGKRLEHARLQIRWHWPVLLRLARLSSPLGVTIMLISLNMNIPRYFIRHYWGERELGFFAALAYLIVAGRTVVGALGQSASPRLASYYATGNRHGFRWLLTRLIGIGALLGLSGIGISLLAGQEILTLLYRKEYAEFAGVLNWIMLAAAVSYLASFLGYALTAARRFKIQPFLFGGVVLLNSLSCLILVPRYGLTGAAWAMGLANLAQLLALFTCVFWALRRLSRKENKWSGAVTYELER